MMGVLFSFPSRRRTLLRVIVALWGAVFLASCSMAPPARIASTKTKSTEYFSSSEYGPASPRLVSGDEAVPKGGGRYMIGEPYTVAGRTYKPKDNPLYSAVGLASWYGDAFHGRLTANGEVYDVSGLTAAHPTMPLPSYARVTNLANNRSIIVRVNDRGPFAHDRIIDVSANVASMLDFKQVGTARVKVDYVGPAQMEGNDQGMLMASYRAPGGSAGADGVLLAMNEATQPRVSLASARPRKPLRADRFQVFDEPSTPVDLVPATANYNDPMAPLILRTGFSSSYAESTDHFTLGQEAAADMASRTIVRLGVFGDRDNAQRMAARFAQYGKVRSSDASSGGHTLQALSVVVDTRKVSPQDVIVAANGVGLKDAFVVSP
jgi:rare lipoprotein A